MFTKNSLQKSSRQSGNRFATNNACGSYHAIPKRKSPRFRCGARGGKRRREFWRAKPSRPKREWPNLRSFCRDLKLNKGELSKFYWRLRPFGYELLHAHACSRRRDGFSRCLLSGCRAASESAGTNKRSSGRIRTIARRRRVGPGFCAEPLSVKNFEREE